MMRYFVLVIAAGLVVDVGALRRKGMAFRKGRAKGRAAVKMRKPSALREDWVQLAQVDQCCDELAKLMTQAKYQHVELAMWESDPEDKRHELLKLIDKAGVDSLDALDAATNIIQKID